MSNIRTIIILHVSVSGSGAYSRVAVASCKIDLWIRMDRKKRRIDTMNYKHLYYFWWVAKAGGVVKAGEQLHITPHTISGQIGILEEDLGTPLYAKRGRNIELTDAGKLAFGYANDIFALGSELEESVRNYEAGGRPIEFRVGVSDAVSKSIACRLIEPATRLPEPVRIVCREWKLDSLLVELEIGRAHV